MEIRNPYSREEPIHSPSAQDHASLTKGYTKSRRSSEYRPRGTRCGLLGSLILDDQAIQGVEGCNFHPHGGCQTINRRPYAEAWSPV